MAKIAKELQIQTDNKPGTLARAAGCIKEADVSIQGVSAWGDGGKSNLYVITENNTKAGESLRKGGFTFTEQEVVTCELPHQVGSLAECAQKISQAGVNIDHCYVTATGPKSLWVLATNNNQKAVGCCP